jgi:hypothetical protein
MNNIDKIEILNDKINNLSKIIDGLSYGISNIPWNESKGIDSREQDLSDYILKKEALVKELQAIQDSDIIY